MPWWQVCIKRHFAFELYAYTNYNLSNAPHMKGTHSGAYSAAVYRRQKRKFKMTHDLRFVASIFGPDMFRLCDLTFCGS